MGWVAMIGFVGIKDILQGFNLGVKSLRRNLQGVCIFLCVSTSRSHVAMYIHIQLRDEWCMDMNLISNHVRRAASISVSTSSHRASAPSLLPIPWHYKISL